MKNYELPEYPVMYKMNMMREEMKKKAISDFMFIYIMAGTGRMAVNGVNHELCKDFSFLVNRFAKLKFETEETMQLVIIRISEDSVKEFLLRYKPVANDITDEANSKHDNRPDTDVEKLPRHLLIHSLVSGIETGLDNDYRASESLVYLKILECLNIITQVLPELYCWLAKKNSVVKVNLHDFMENHYRDNEPLGQLALASGRSLSTFRRDFIKEFGMTPGKWLLARRLKEACRLMVQEKRHPSSFIYELGFEIFSHFSRSFKTEYGVRPSSLPRK